MPIDLNFTVDVSPSGVCAGVCATGSASAPRARAGSFGYDATEDLGRRKAPVPLLRSEDDELPIYRRNQVISLGRDIRRNFSLAAWAVRCHLNYVSRFRFRSMTGNRDLDKRINELVAWCGKPENFDASRRHGLRRFTRLVEAGRTVDGDVLPVKLANGRLQAIEGDRVRTPISYGLPSAPPPLSADLLKRMKFGVVTDDAGAPLAYAVNRRGPAVRMGPDIINPANAFTFERLVSARNCIHVGYFDRFDQTRGVSPLAAALNSFRDTYEGFDYALAQAKVTQLFALAIKRNSLRSIQAFAEGEEGPTNYRKSLDFNRGPVLLDLDPGDEAQFLNSQNPSDNWQAFMQNVIAVALKSLDIPFSFYDESHTNYSGSRGAWLAYDQSAEDKAEDLREFLDRWCAWRLGMLIYQGVLELPAGMDPVRDLRWQWIRRRVPWIDPLKEIQAAKLEVDAGFNCTPGIAELVGEDAYELADRQADYLAYRKALGLPPLGALPPVPVQYEPAEPISA